MFMELSINLYDITTKITFLIISAIGQKKMFVHKCHKCKKMLNLKYSTVSQNNLILINHDNTRGRFC
jgi:hypothetical protein